MNGIVFYPQVQAQVQLEDDTYQLELEQVQIDSDADPAATATPTPVPAQDTLLYGKEWDEFNKKGFIIKKDVPATNSESDIRLSVSKTEVRFQVEQDSIPPEDTVILTVSSDNPTGYQISSWQDNLLTSITQNTIPNTRCNTGDMCTPYTSSLWKDTSAYGFGYRMEGSDIPYDFTQHYYRPFPLWQKETPVTVMSNSHIATTRQSSIFFKLNPPPSMQEGTYKNVIYIIAFPKL